MMSAVTLNQPGLREASVGFAERLLEVIDSGRRTATYKLALLIALLDLCAQHSDAETPAVVGRLGSGYSPAAGLGLFRCRRSGVCCAGAGGGK